MGALAVFRSRWSRRFKPTSTRTGGGAEEFRNKSVRTCSGVADLPYPMTPTKSFVEVASSSICWPSIQCRLCQCQSHSEERSAWEDGQPVSEQALATIDWRRPWHFVLVALYGAQKNLIHLRSEQHRVGGNGNTLWRPCLCLCTTTLYACASWRCDLFYAQELLVHDAARSGHLALLQKLISSGVSVCRRSTTGASPLHWAARYDQADAIQVRYLPYDLAGL
jgi:hypothetical protein